MQPEVQAALEDQVEQEEEKVEGVKPVVEVEVEIGEK